MNLIKNIELKKKVYGGIDGAVHLLVAQQAARLGQLVYIARDDARMAQMQRALAALTRHWKFICCLHGIACPMTGYRRIQALSRNGLKPSLPYIG